MGGVLVFLVFLEAVAVGLFEALVVVFGGERVLDVADGDVVGSAAAHGVDLWILGLKFKFIWKFE